MGLDNVILIFMLIIHPNYGENQNIDVSSVQKVKKCLYYSTGQWSEPTLWRHTLWQGKMAAPLLLKAVTKHPFFFKMVSLMFMYFFD